MVPKGGVRPRYQRTGQRFMTRRLEIEKGGKGGKERHDQAPHTFPEEEGKREREDDERGYYILKGKAVLLLHTGAAGKRGEKGKSLLTLASS